MDKKKTIIIWENGRQTKLNINDNDTSKESHEVKRELAASLQESENGQIPTFSRPNTNKYKENSNKQQKYTFLKPVIFAVLSAIIIGTILGVIMLRMFVTMGEDSPATGETITPIMDTEEENTNDENEAVSETISENHESISAFVLQAGVFSEESNANEWASDYYRAGLPGVIWERDNQYFLLVGLTNSKEQAMQLAADLEKDGFETFIKEWKTNGSEIELTNTEHAWLHDFHEHWYMYFNSLNEQTVLSGNEWKDLITAYPEASEKLSTISQEIIRLQKEMDESDKVETQNILLELWKQYEYVF
ncbi:hypothetical protein QGM71_00850 [Virgibacillus sp. C22-A2]|uniref:SPOR domain-containing protein n=1 Tax=Virgibacillus tibetensis TaxID=3042313 RepID=A0ABU6K9W9_9BACI|nr:hypothetical protein [Virgibacillus sp. C22-A2]